MIVAIMLIKDIMVAANYNYNCKFYMNTQPKHRKTTMRILEMCNARFFSKPIRMLNYDNDNNIGYDNGNNVDMDFQSENNAIQHVKS